LKRDGSFQCPASAQLCRLPCAGNDRRDDSAIDSQSARRRSPFAHR
jgi:hypothetical protein